MDFTDDPERDADLYYMHQDEMHERYMQMFDEIKRDCDTFSNFIYDTDWSDPYWRDVHNGVVSNEMADKLIAMDKLEAMYDDYVGYMTDEAWEDL